VSAPSSAVAWAFLSASLALVVILVALGIALVIYQRRFVAMHRTYADGLLAAQETERAWVAREVHDDALQRIMILLHELDALAVLAAGSLGLTERIEAFRAELEDLSAALRQMAYRLHPSFHEQEGLVPMLERLASEIEHSAGLRIDVRAPEQAPPPLTAEQSLVVYRVAQEALNNVLRHSGSTWALVAVQTEDHTLDLRVEDYGTGFDTARPPREGLGLISMTERARAAGGILSVESHPGGGTRVHLRLPAGDGA
jgi:signal transduction histidine kinase